MYVVRNNIIFGTLLPPVLGFGVFLGGGPVGGVGSQNYRPGYFCREDVCLQRRVGIRRRIDDIHFFSCQCTSSYGWYSHTV